jgi:hypothetical protein
VVESSGRVIRSSGRDKVVKTCRAHESSGRDKIVKTCCMCASSVVLVLRVSIFLPPRPLRLLIFFETRDPVNEDKNEKQFLVSVVLSNRH